MADSVPGPEEVDPDFQQSEASVTHETAGGIRLPDCKRFSFFRSRFPVIASRDLPG
jgi:hypothetical protein